MDCVKILLLVDVPPCKEFSGSLLTEQLCKFIPETEIKCFVALNKDLSYVKFTSDLKNVEYKYVTKPKENSGLRFKGVIGRIYSVIYEYYVEYVAIPRLKKQAVQYGKEKNVDAVWVIVQGQTIIRLGNAVAKAINVPLLTQVWDHPLWWFKEKKVTNFWQKKFLKKFGHLISQSQCCGTASPNMSSEFEGAYHIKTVPFIASIPDDYILPPAKEINRENYFLIGMAGQLYSKVEWENFLIALDGVNWEIAGKKVKLVYLGYHLTVSGHKVAHVEYLGYRPQPETIEILSQVDLLYCPYFFDPYYEIISRTSFPSKLVTYLAAGRPIFFHGPDFSSPAKFLVENDAGIICNTFEPSIIVNRLTQIATDKTYYSRIAENGSAALRSRLSNEVLKKYFFEFINYAKK